MSDLLKPDDLRKIADDLDMAKAKKMMEHLKTEEAERDKIKEAFNSREIHAQVKERVNAAIRRAAEQGNTDAQFNLGGMYFKGQGVKQDLTLAYMWVTLAAAKGDAEAIKNRGLMAAQMTPAQLAEAQRLAREWKPTSPR